MVAERWCGLVTTFEKNSVSAGYGTDGSTTADDGGGAAAFKAAELNDFAEDVGIGVQRVAPEGILENDGAGGIGAIVTGAKQAAHHGLQSHDVEIISIDDAGANLAWFAEADDGEADFGKRAELGDGVEVAADVLNFRDEKATSSSAMPGALWRI